MYKQTTLVDYLSKYVKIMAIVINISWLKIMKQSNEQTDAIDLQNGHIATQISKAINSRGISESKLAKDLNLPYNTIKRLVMGETSDPRYSTLKLISEYLNISIDELLDNKQAKPVMLPLLPWDNICDNLTNTSCLNNETWHDWIPISSSTASSINSNSFALKSLPSMSPRFSDNTVFIIDPSLKPVDGDLVLVKFKKTNEASLKDLIIDPPNWMFKSLVDHASHITKNDYEHEIIGVVYLTLIYNR